MSDEQRNSADNDTEDHMSLKVRSPEPAVENDAGPAETTAAADDDTEGHGFKWRSPEPAVGDDA
ncbi:MAG: hypothetical protein H0V74_02255 [Chloroflexi bacterium]|nr:hypothetical protein [Chloroflexota bacterium]